MKIAVCIRGELRTWFTANKNILGMFPKDSTDFFFTTWKKVYNPLLSEPEIVDEHAVVQSFSGYNLIGCKVLPLEIDLSIKADRISILMATQWFECNKLKRKHEADNNFSYDYVFCIRPDVVYLRSPFTVEELERWNDAFVVQSDGSFTSEQSFGGIYSPDVFLAGSSFQTDIVSDYFFYLRDNHTTNNLWIHDATHNTLAEHFLNNRIVLRNDLLNRSSLEILRPGTEIDISRLHCLTTEERVEFHKTFSDWYKIENGTVYKYLDEELAPKYP